MATANLPEIDDLIARHKAGGGGLIELLQEVSARYQYVPREVVEKISRELDVPLTQLYSLATFYQSFKLAPPGRHHVCVCTGTACHVRGAPRLVETLERDLKVKAGQTTADGRITVDTVNCLGTCAIGPIVTVDGRYYGNMTSDGLTKLVKKIE
jgi:NADH:ubiquinone oxidoreductase subunit E